eukprot:159028_1
MALFAALFVGFCALGVLVRADCTVMKINGMETCYKDDWGNPILQYWAYTLDTSSLDHEICMTACNQHDATFNYFGIENGADPMNAECWCGNMPRIPADMSQGCTATCPGNSGELCGGEGTLMSLYMFSCGGTPPNPPVPEPPGPQPQPVPVPPGPQPEPPGPQPEPQPVPVGPPTNHTGGAKAGGSKLGGGGIFCILFFGLIIIYLVAGLLVNKFVRKQEGLEIIPNWNIWKNIPGAIIGAPKYLWKR